MSADGYEYVCADGHGTWSPQPLGKCPTYINGKPCTGALKRVGAGSRKGS